ncbi:efflux RND transporter permease subunit [Halodesulfurarchaeum sp.]|uniref:efflux RND transporter permease subunit n=1 Tax=Halodesulfurarchaeum sp. TaxID=1980530 RepID=UPI002FC2F1C1
MSESNGFAATIASLVVDRPGTVVIVFLILTGAFGAGLQQVSMSGGTGQFTEASPAQESYDEVQAQFGSPFAVETGSTLVIHRDENVLSKASLVRMLDVQEGVSARSGLRVQDTSSPATYIARELDPTADTLTAQHQVIDRATPSEIGGAVETAEQNPEFRELLSEDFNSESARATAAIGVFSHEVPGRDETAVGVTADSAFRETQLELQDIVTTYEGDFTVYGSGIIAEEFGQIIVDSLQIVVPAASLLILGLLFLAFRDLFDFLIGVFALVTALVWTFGLMGWAGIAFSQLLIAIPPLLLGVGIDFGIHVINGYRERATKEGLAAAMRPTMRQLVVAFGIVTGTTVLGFSANLTSQLAPIRDFGVIAALGILVTFLVFGIYLPAIKVLVERLRERLGSQSEETQQTGVKSPIGKDGSVLEPLLTAGIVFGRRAPKLVLVGVLLTGIVAGGYGAGVETSFSDEDFLPPEDIPDYIEYAPEPFGTGTYTVTESTNFLEANFEPSSSDSLTIYYERPMTGDTSLELIDQAGSIPPSAIEQSGVRTESRSIQTVIDTYASQSPEFAILVARNDRDGNGVPDDNLEAIYAALRDSPHEASVERYLSDSNRQTVVYYDVESDATQSEVSAAGTLLENRLRGDATATGTTVIFADIAGLIYESAIISLLAAIGITAVFLVLVYHFLFREWMLGLVNLLPILLTVTLVLATMRAFDMKFNALTATLLAVTIGMGVDYSVHLVHRFIEEYEGTTSVYNALYPTMRGTGGALTGSMLTTAAGVGILGIAITPILQTFGILTALSIIYAYLTSMIILPAALIVWDRFGSMTEQKHPQGDTVVTDGGDREVDEFEWVADGRNHEFKRVAEGENDEFEWVADGRNHEFKRVAEGENDEFEWIGDG